jgi:very-short-patch-repair endonuclease
MKRLPHEDKKYLFVNAWRMLAPNGPTPVPEFPYDRVIGRRHLFDWAFPAYMVAVEVDGGVHLPGGGRHGQDRDRDKLNCAAELGWRVLRFSVAMLERDPAGCVAQVVRALTYQGS